MIKTALIGIGYWGPNILRNLYKNKQVKVEYVCDLEETRLKDTALKYKDIKYTKYYDEVLKSKNVDAVFIATGPGTHYDLARKAILSGRDVFIEKPMTVSSKDSVSLINLADNKNKILMVGHIFEYSTPVLKIKDLIDKKKLGKIFYIDSERANIGLFQKDVNVVWDLAPHDFSILNKFFPAKSCVLNAVAKCNIKKKVEDLASITVKYDNGIICNILVSWVTPDKIRKMTVTGSDRMVTYDDTELHDPLKIFNKKGDKPFKSDTYGEFQSSYKYADILIPRIKLVESLKVECSHFIKCVKKRVKPESDGISGYKVVKQLEAVHKSIAKGSKFIKVDLT